MSLFQLVYASHLCTDESVLPSIHSHAVRNDTAHVLSGMLLYANGRFLQVIEGERKDVLQTFSYIKQDERHDQLHVLSEKDIAEKTFTHWNMGFKHLQKDDLLAHPEFAAYLTSPFEQMKANPGTALAMLKAYSPAVKL